MTSAEMNKEHFCFGGDFEIFLMSMIYKMQIIFLKNDLKDLVLGINTHELYSFLGFEILHYKDASNLTFVPPFLLLSNKFILHKYV